MWHVRLGAIRRNTLAADNTFAVLTSFSLGQYFFRTEWLDGMQDLGMFVADGARLERNWRLHGGQADELHDVVRHHVAQRAGFVVVTSALLHPHCFGNADLHVVDIAA